MTVTARKYNPGFLTDEELMASFCVRTREFESMVEMLRECTGSSNPHQIVIGPRGSGKTSLLLRVAAEVRQDPELSLGFFPVVFAEESYEVDTAGEFWLEALSRLADEVPSQEDAPDLRRTLEDLRTIQDDRTLGDRCLGTLLDYSDREGKRVVLMVENLNMMFRDMSDRDAGWRLRKVLQTEPRIILLASATSRFDEIDHPDHALYDLFRVLMLRPLDTQECAVLWRAVAGKNPPPETIRSLEILTGGSPRLVAIVARFGAARSFRELMKDLLDLVDDHTEYFKSHIESLPAQERRVYLALADLWKPATTREIAERTRIETSKCSAQLTRLSERGVVQVTGGSARRKQYYLAERLYNIYYLLRRNRGQDSLIEALIQFMESYYSPTELMEIGAGIAREMEDFDKERQMLHRAALERLAELPALAGHREELLARIPQSLLKPDRNPVLSQKALAALDDVVRRFDQSKMIMVPQLSAMVLMGKGVLLGKLNRFEEALAAMDEVVLRFGESESPVVLRLVGEAILSKGLLLTELKRPEEAPAVFEDAVRRFGEKEGPMFSRIVAEALLYKGVVVGRLGRSQEALAVLDDAVRRFGENEVTIPPRMVAMALYFKGTLLGGLKRPEEALATYDEVVHRFRDSVEPAVLESVASAFVEKGIILDELNRSGEALAAFEEVVRRFWGNDSPVFRRATDRGLLGKAEIELKVSRHVAAVETASRILNEPRTESQENRLRGHLIRAEAFLGNGDRTSCEQDLNAVLAILPELDTLPKKALVALMEFSIDLGGERMCEIIQASPSTKLLLPLTTALEQELGREPRVAREVEEVARDIRRDLEELRKARADGSGK